MNLEEMKKKALGLIEELNPQSVYLTEDPDIAAKLNHVINQVMFELARFKKIPRYLELPVTAGETIDFSRLEQAVGNEIYQIALVTGVDYLPRASGTVLQILESGTARIDLFIYPERITEKTRDKGYEFELSPDALEIMPYGIAADLLKSDVSAEYGKIYADRYEQLLTRLDQRYSLGAFTFEGGIR